MVSSGCYQIGILGQPNGHERTFGDLLQSRLDELGVAPGSVKILPESEVCDRDRKCPFIGVFFGYSGALTSRHKVLPDLIEDSVVIIPLVTNLSQVGDEIPEALQHVNCLRFEGTEAHGERLVTLVLENFHLLRPERRLFISYRRVEAQSVAIQIYEALDAAGFDVFLDTRSVPPAADFQGVLWHRLTDCDVVVLLDTPGFLQSRWTREELARANVTSIQILHLVWPASVPDQASAFSEFFPLQAADFASAIQTGKTARLEEATVNRVAVQVEALRARALSARHRYLVDNFCDQARTVGQNVSVQSARLISLELNGGKKIAAVPMVGIPNAARYQDIEMFLVDNDANYDDVWLLYDERGVLVSWLQHVDWLNQHLPITAVRVSESAVTIESVGP